MVSSEWVRFIEPVLPTGPMFSLICFYFLTTVTPRVIRDPEMGRLASSRSNAALFFHEITIFNTSRSGPVCICMKLLLPVMLFFFLNGVFFFFTIQHDIPVLCVFLKNYNRTFWRGSSIMIWMLQWKAVKKGCVCKKVCYLEIQCYESIVSKITDKKYFLWVPFS